MREEGAVAFPTPLHVDLGAAEGEIEDGREGVVIGAVLLLALDAEGFEDGIVHLRAGLDLLAESAEARLDPGRPRGGFSQAKLILPARPDAPARSSKVSK